MIFGRVEPWDPVCPKCSRRYERGQPPKDWTCVQCSTKVWQPDDDVDSCHACRTKRLSKGSRHHCRMCGNLACDNCSRFTTTIPGWGPEKYRVCALCAVPQEDTVCEGFLSKLGSKSLFGGEKLQRRFFELRGCCLVYGQTKESARYGCINISGCRVMDDPSHANGLCLVGQQLARAYILTAESPDDKRRWMQALEEAMRREADTRRRGAAVSSAPLNADGMEASVNLGDDPAADALGGLGGGIDRTGVGNSTSSVHGALGGGAHMPSVTDAALQHNARVRAECEQRRLKQRGLRDFDILRVIGTGAFSHSLLVRLRGTSQLLVMKAYDKAEVLSARLAYTVNNERLVQGQIAGLFDPALNFVVRMKFAFETHTHLFLLTEWCPGGEMYFHLQLARRFSESRARQYIAEVAVALDAFHRRGIIYRDLKPENVVLRANGRVALIDLALAEKVGPMAGASDPTTPMLNEQHRATTMCGVPEYMAPEVLDRRGHSMASDWWCLGVLLYEFVAGVPPFDSRSGTSLYVQVCGEPVEPPKFFSKDMASLITKLLERDPNMRLKSLQHLFAHPFFKGLTLQRVISAEGKLDFVPQLQSDADTKYFSPNFTQIHVPSYLDQPVDESATSPFPGYAFPVASDDEAQQLSPGTASPPDAAATA